MSTFLEFGFEQQEEERQAFFFFFFCENNSFIGEMEVDQDDKGKGREDDKGKGKEGRPLLKATRIVKGAPGEEEEEEWEGGSVSQSGKVFNYVVTAQKPTAVTHSVVGNFTDSDDLNLIICKSSLLEIFKITASGLVPLYDVSLYGCVFSMKLFRPGGFKKDLLLICTQCQQVCVLEYEKGDENGKDDDVSTGGTQDRLITRAKGTVGVKQQLNSRQIGLVDPEARAICLFVEDGCLKVIPMTSSGHLENAFNLRLDELLVKDICFLHGCERPTLALLYQDNRGNQNVRTREIVIEEKELVDGPWKQPNVEAGASALLPVPLPLGGVLVVGEETVSYLNGSSSFGKVVCSTTMPTTIMNSFNMVDPDGSRWLLGDYVGRLFVLFLERDASGVVKNLHLEPLGTTSISSTISYLDNGVVFVGSKLGDSQLIKLAEEKRQETGAFFDILDSFTNLGPIVDFCIVDSDKQGQGQVVSCSGAFKDGSLRVVRNGVGINEQASLEIPGVSGVWALSRQVSSGMQVEENDEEKHNVLAISLIGQTHFLQLEGEEMSPIGNPGDLILNEQTIFCGNITPELMLQITPFEIVSFDATNLGVKGRWKVGEEEEAGRINVCSSSGGQVLVGTGSGKVIYLEVDKKNGEITQKSQTKLNQDISCLDITPFTNNSKSGDSQLCVVGLWDVQVAILKLPSLEVVSFHPLGGEIIARSVLLVDLEGILYLLVGLGDGHLLTYVMEENGGFGDRRKISLGTQPIQLRSFVAKGQKSVFASSDRPTVIYSKNKKLLYSNVNLKSVTSVCCFSAESFPDSLVIVNEEQLIIGSIDEIQKLHIQTIELGESPYRITYVEHAKSYAVLTVGAPNDENDTEEIWHVRLMDEKTFELNTSYQLESSELGCSIAYLNFSGDPNPHLVVGTTYYTDKESEPTKGRILIFGVTDSKLILEAQVQVNGAVYDLEPFNGKLLAAINSKAQLFAWHDKEGQELKPVEGVSTYGNTLALFVRSRGDFVVIGDLITSIRLFLYKEEESALEDIAQDNTPKWLTGMEMLDDDTYLVSDNSLNLVTLRKNNEGTTSEDRGHLEEAGLFHLGEFINRIRHGSLVMALPEAGESPIPTCLYATVDGSIGVVASLQYKDFEFFSKIEERMRKVVNGIGGLKHEEWRAFKSERRTAKTCGFIDGDLVEAFLDLSRENMEQVINDLPYSVEEVTRMIQTLARQLH